MEIEIFINESKKIDEMTISNLGGGHKILRGENGMRRGGDLPFSEIELTLEWQEGQKITVFHPIDSESESENEDIHYGPYHITVICVDWNGASVKFSIEKDSIEK